MTNYDSFNKQNRLFGTVDTNLIIGITLLCVLSVINLFSAGFVPSETESQTLLQYLSSSKPALKQLSYFGIGGVLILFISFVSVQNLPLTKQIFLSKT